MKNSEKPKKLQKKQAQKTLKQRRSEKRAAPKKYGAGYTFNYGRPLAWVITFAILIVPLAIAIFATFNAR